MSEQQAPVLEAPATPAVVSAKDDPLLAVLSDPNRQAYSGETGTHYEPLDVTIPAGNETPVTPTPDAPVVPDAKTPETPVTPTPEVKTPETPAAPEKVYANKFKTPEDLEKGYAELEKSFHKKSEELAAAKKAPVVPDKDAEDKKAELINNLLLDPEKTITEITQQASQQAQMAADAQRQADDWRKTNPDIAQLDFYVGAEMNRLISLDPKLREDTAAALNAATTNVRAAYRQIYDAGKKEAMSVQASVTPLASSKVQVAPPTEQPAKAPVSEESARSEHLRMLEANARKVRGGR